MQTFTSAGLAADRAEIGQELITTAFDADSPTFEINGRLIRMQALCAMNDISSASTAADTVDRLAQRHERTGELSVIRRALGALEPARQGGAAGTGVLDLGRVDHYLGLLEVAAVSA
ncbi:hypothetical protein [Paenarthrobacter nitroguajacolicus]